jgi:glycosyltransferase involved in cell wall biosynthesis
MISIIISCYNSDKFIYQTINSIFSQDYLDFEIIIIDAGSTDGTVEIIKSFSKKNLHFEIIRGISFPDALTYGFSKAKGQVFTFLNSDDYYISNNIFSLVSNLFASVDVDVIYGNGVYVDEFGKYLHSYNSKKVDKRSFILNANSNICQPSAFFTKEIFDKFVSFNSNFNCLVDLDLWTKFLFFGAKFYYVKGPPFSAYRLHPSSFSIGGKSKMLHDLLLYYDDNLKYFNGSELKEYNFFQLFRIANYYWAERNISKSKKYFKLCINNFSLYFLLLDFNKTFRVFYMYIYLYVKHNNI